MSDKNPFELRFDALQMAKDYYDRIYDAQVKFAKANFDASVEAGKATWADWDKYIPKHTIDDIIAKATELSAFVNKRS